MLAEDTISHVQAEMVPGRNGGKLRPVRTSEQGRALVEKRIARRRAMAVAGVEEALREGVDDAPPGADYWHWYKLVYKHKALNSLDPSAPGSQKDFADVDSALVPKLERGAGAGEVPAGGLQLNLSADLAERLLTRLAQLGAGQAPTVIDQD